MARRFLLLLALAALLAGCSSSSSMLIHNELNKDVLIELTYPYERTNTNHGSNDVHRVEVPAHSAEGEAVWFGEGPPWIQVRVLSNGQEIMSKRLSGKDFPPEMFRFTSMGYHYHLHISKSDIALKGPNSVDRLRRDFPILFTPAGACCLLCPVVVVIAIIAIVRRQLRKPNPCATPPIIGPPSSPSP